MPPKCSNEIPKVDAAYKRINSQIINCGNCCLIHEQFTLNIIKNRTSQPRTDVIYVANQFRRCPSQEVEATLNGSIYPFGTIVTRNLSAVPVNFIVYGDVEEETSMIVQPNSEVAVTLSAISAVEVNYPTDPIRLLFTFDIFHPGDPI